MIEVSEKLYGDISEAQIVKLVSQYERDVETVMEVPLESECLTI